jgi:hypothetical protein
MLVLSGGNGTEVPLARSSRVALLLLGARLNLQARPGKWHSDVGAGASEEVNAMFLPRTADAGSGRY